MTAPERVSPHSTEEGSGEMAKRQEIRCRGWVPDGAGGWRSVEDDLTPEERAEFGRQLVQRMGRALNDHFSACPEEYERI